MGAHRYSSGAFLVMGVKISSAVWEAKIGDPVAKLVLLRLADRADDKTGKCWPMISTISEETELCERTVLNKLRILESLGMIVSIRGKNRCDYDLVLEKIGSTTAPHAVTATAPHALVDDLATASPSVATAFGSVVTASPSITTAPHAVTLLEEPPMNPHRTPIEPSTCVREDLKSQKKREDQKMAETIYEAYPRKVARPKAVQSILKAMSKIDHPTLLRKTQAYAAATKGTDPQFIPHPATWFNQERFGDEPETWAKSQSSNSAYPSQPARNIDVSGKVLKLPESKKY